MIPVEQYTEYMRLALVEIAVKLGDILLKGLAILLSELYKHLLTSGLAKARELNISISEQDIRQELPKHSFLSRLMCIFGKHLDYETKQLYIGAVLFRPGTDMLCCLSKTLKLMQNANVSVIPVKAHPAPPTVTDADPEEQEQKQFDKLYAKLNERVHSQVNKWIEIDAIMPYDISRFNPNDVIATIDPALWKMVVKITGTVTESRRKTPPKKIRHQRKLNCLYALCVMFIAHNRSCSVPMHLLLADLVESHGGSNELITMLNRFGAVACVDTHRRYVQYQIKQKVSSGFLSDLNMDRFTIASVDNINFLQSHSFVYCGDQSRSWHGTTMQVVQPKGEARGENMEVAQREQPLIVELPDSAQGPAHKKVTRRSRSLSENKDVHAAIFNNQAQKELLNRGPLSELSYNHYTPLKSGHTLEEFHMTAKEETEYKKLQEMALLYIAYR